MRHWQKRRGRRDNAALPLLIFEEEILKWKMQSITYCRQWGGILFGPVMLCVYFGVGLMFTVLLKGVQFRRFGAALRECVFHKQHEGTGQIKSMQALATALSSCVGNGNVVGVVSSDRYF